MSYIKSIGLDELINVILVKEKVRPAFLLQPIDYKETKGTDPITSLKLKNIHNLFPELIFSENYTPYQGVLISYDNFDGTYISRSDMGKILGYPCYLDTFDNDKDDYSIHVIAILKNSKYCFNNIRSFIFSNRCGDKTKEIEEEFESFANKAFNTLKQYKDILTLEIDKVIVNYDLWVSNKNLINKITNKENLEKHYKDKVINVLYNFGFSNNFLIYFEKNFQYDNQIHIGILLSLLLNSENDLLGVIIPVQNNLTKEKCEMLDNIILRWEKDLTKVIDKTKTG